MDDKGKPKRERRSKKQIENDIWDALERVLEERTFNDIPLSVFVKEAGIDPNILYRHYGTMDVLYENFVDRYSSWMSNIIKENDINKLGYRKFYTETFNTLYTELKTSKTMQRIIQWELSEDNFTTRKTSRIREEAHSDLIARYENIFKASGIDIKCITALLFAGVYYIALHKNTLCSVNFTGSAGQEKISKAIDAFGDLIFDKLEEKKRLQKSIRLMRRDGIPQIQIAKYLGISIAQLTKIR